MNPFNESAAGLIKTAHDLIGQILLKHANAILEEMNGQIVNRNKRISESECEILRLRAINAELLAALRYLVNLSSHPLFAEQNDLPLWDQRIAEARAAIAKATQS